MLRISSAIAAFTAAANALSEAERANECYDFWNKLEEAGVGDLDFINVDIGSGINAGSSTSVGTGTGISFGRTHLVHATEDGDFGVDVPTNPGGVDENGIAIGVGAGVGLSGSTSTAVESGVGIVQKGSVATTDLYAGDLGNLHIPGFDNVFENGNHGNMHRYGGGYSFGDTGKATGNWRLRRRLMRDMCGPPPATGGDPVTCASTGDPHLVDFRGRRFDMMAFGEFMFYNSWEPLSHHPVTNLRIQVRTGPYNGNQRVAVNKGIVIGGRFACGNKYEIHKPNTGATPVLKIMRRRTGEVEWARGKAAIYAKLSGETCPKVQIQGDVAHFIFEQDANEDKTTLRVQIVSYGLNLGLDVLGQTVRLETDRGVCTKNAGWDMQLECSHSMFSWYPAGVSCHTLQRGGMNAGPPQRCPATLVNTAERLCRKCPETIHPKGCVYDACAAELAQPGSGVSFIDEIMGGCRVGARLPKNINVRVGTGLNMKDATAVNVGRGTGINYGESITRVVEG